MNKLLFNLDYFKSYIRSYKQLCIQLFLIIVLGRHRIYHSRSAPSALRMLIISFLMVIAYGHRVEFCVE
jgi:hypothetical protein